MSSGQTKFPKSTVPTRQVHQRTAIVGKNGLTVDALATLEPGSVLIQGGTSLSYTQPTITFDASVDLSTLGNIIKTAQHTGVLLFTDGNNNSYFIDPDSVDNINKTVDIYIDTEFTSSPTSINLDIDWVIAEAELVNRLQTTTTAVIDNVEFRDVSVNVDLDGSTVNIKDDDGDQLSIDSLGNADVKIHGTDQNGIDQIVKTSERREIINKDFKAQNTIEELNFGVTTLLNSIAGTIETPYLLIKNPIGSGKTLRIFRSRTGVNSKTSASVFRTYINPIVDVDGTALNINNLYIKVGAAASVMQAFRFPTVSNNGSLSLTTVVPSSFRTVPEDFDHYIILDPGFSALVTIQNDQNNTPVHIDLFWAEI